MKCMIWKLYLLTAGLRRGRARTAELSVAVRSGSLPSGLKVHPLCLSLDIHSICLSPWNCVPCLSLPNLVLIAQFPAPYLGQSKEHPYISLKFLGRIWLAWLHSPCPISLGRGVCTHKCREGLVDQVWLAEPTPVNGWKGRSQ